MTYFHWVTMFFFFFFIIEHRMTMLSCNRIYLVYWFCFVDYLCKMVVVDSHLVLGTLHGEVIGRAREIVITSDVTDHFLVIEAIIYVIPVSVLRFTRTKKIQLKIEAILIGMKSNNHDIEIGMQSKMAVDRLLLGKMIESNKDIEMKVKQDGNGVNKEGIDDLSSIQMELLNGEENDYKLFQVSTWKIMAFRSRSDKDLNMVLIISMNLFLSKLLPVSSFLKYSMKS